ncbi:hypothetical protein [Pseudoalteromonas luteoviolacea]|uniref:Outer membrane protein beta-barrel domain-containing protein n=1 Tax=Pseudoalteromonas luteoviolacea S4054 TaxID=1129367 RepID=A0A0F6A976_9GAMM|nr:hypothetical protein [Pseudoalteromonas luteoviolacea]AOT06915.1 hypothetical protein S4054249_03050 [Pseudoalteromonas luteoviolacea]AOT11833.1 hypothetical protein S40542_03050 [Pseudoalteromonas luteoviolacea]AOT16745.1 hypothetical protein S4054_03050 [Pseudoalteromonas luteoviolacea]KKE82757.1 hypothetical protein N479_17020 [Pseudoalteromonas luteoviolacea S4054]KZN72968.1 hypothetical protein N481_14025 [Pseudoalteromonas luteoviolacea S4047-1]
MKQCAAVLTSLIVLSGCESTPPEADPGSVRLDSPEVHSQPFNVKLAIGSDKGRSIPIDDSPLGSNEAGHYASAEMSLGGGFSAKYQVGKAVKGSIKYQLSGQNAETAQAGNISHAITLGYLTDHESGREKGKNDDSPSRDWELDHDLIDVAWITGYRLSEDFLVYGSVFYQFGEIDGAYYSTYIEGCGESRAPECVQSRFSDDGSAYGLSLSVEYAITKHFLYSLEVSHSRTNWFNRNENDTLVNGNITYQF